MGFHKPDLNDAYTVIRRSMYEIESPYNDGFTGMHCKQELYVLKCWLEDAYAKLPTYVGEEKWEQERLVQLLKR